MNFFAERYRAVEPVDLLRSNHVVRLLRAQLREFHHVLAENPFIPLIIGSALIAAHLLIVILQPRSADSYVYFIVALSVLLTGTVLFAQSRAATGVLSLRWYLLTLSMAAIAMTYLRAAVEVATGHSFDHLDAVLRAADSTLLILALTLPSSKRKPVERAFDLSIALFFCALRIVYLHTVFSSAYTNTLTVITFEYGIQMLLVVLALVAAPASELAFFRGTAVWIAAMGLSAVCCNQIGYTLLGQHTNSPWMLTDTVSRVGGAIYYLHGFLTKTPVRPERPYRVVLSRLMPCAMSVLLIWLSIVLLPDHVYLGRMGIAVGIVGFLARVVFIASHSSEVVLEEALVREIASEVMKDPLFGFAERNGLEAALLRAKPSVGPRSALSLVLFAVDEPGKLTGIFEEFDSRDLGPIARTLNLWNTPGSTICYLGRGRFAMLLPATPLRVAVALAEQICLSVDALALAGENGSIGIIAGVAVCVEPARVSSLLRVASAALDRASRHREGSLHRSRINNAARFDA